MKLLELLKLPRPIVWLFFAAGLGMLAGAGFLFQNARGFIQAAERVEGTVIDLLPSRSDTGTRVTVSFSPVVEFRTRAGQDIEFRSPVSTSPPAYREGDKVQVLYRPATPEDAEIEDFFSLWGNATVLAGMGAVFSSIALATALAGSDRRRRRRLLRTGTPVRAKIMAIERDERVGKPGRHPFRVLAHWKDPVTAEVHVFQSEPVWHDPTPRFDSPYIVVHVDPRNPKQYAMDTDLLHTAA